MRTHSVETFRRLAFDLLSRIDFGVREDYIESILEAYTTVCQFDNLREHMPQRPITDEMRLRLRFECLCLSAFFAMSQSSRRLTRKKWFATRPDKRLGGLFHGAIAITLVELCNNAGMTAFHETVLVSMHPVQFGLGDHLDALNRLKEYRFTFARDPRFALEQFGKYIGMALDAPHWPTLGIIGESFVMPLGKLSVFATKSVLE